MRWKTLYWNIIFSLKHGSVQTHDNFVNSYPYIITFCLLSHFIYIYIYNEILIKRFSEKNLCLSSYQTILYFYYHQYTLSQYPGGDCSTNWEKCQILKILWTRRKFPPGRQRNPLGDNEAHWGDNETHWGWNENPVSWTVKYIAQT